MDPALAVVQKWDDDEGWGVCSAEEFPGGCWVHFSVVDVPGLHSLAVGDAVRVVAERAEQDGYAFRATQCWPAVADEAGSEGDDEPPDHVVVNTPYVRGEPLKAWDPDDDIHVLLAAMCLDQADAEDAFLDLVEGRAVDAGGRAAFGRANYSAFMHNFEPVFALYRELVRMDEALSAALRVRLLTERSR